MSDRTGRWSKPTRGLLTAGTVASPDVFRVFRVLHRVFRVFRQGSRRRATAPQHAEPVHDETAMSDTHA